MLFNAVATRYLMGFKLFISGGRGGFGEDVVTMWILAREFLNQYVDALETGQDSRAAVNLHNNEAGRLVS